MTLLLMAFPFRSCAYTGRECPDCNGFRVVDPEVYVVVGKRELEPGETIVADMLTTVEMWESKVPDGVLRSSDALIGRVPRERILAREMVREERLAPVEAGVGVKAVLPEGTVAVPVLPGAGDFAPGQIVDLLVTARGSTRTVLEAQPIVAMRGDLPLLAIPRDRAPALEHLLAIGVPTLVLRGDLELR